MYLSIPYMATLMAQHDMSKKKYLYCSSNRIKQWKQCSAWTKDNSSKNLDQKLEQDPLYGFSEGVEGTHKH